MSRAALRIALVVGLLWILATLLLMGMRPSTPRYHIPTTHPTLLSGVVASMDSPVFAYSPGWRVTTSGADPSEPSVPWDEPSGTLEFEYSGERLDLLLAVGDYWGYLYVTVDGQPANRLATIPGNHNSRQAVAGYRTFYAPERQMTGGPEEEWVTVHEASTDSQPHEVYIEVWRSWDKRPLRAIAIDPHTPYTLPIWPGVLLFLLGIVGEAYFRTRRHTSSISTDTLPSPEASVGQQNHKPKKETSNRVATLRVMPQSIAHILLPPLPFSLSVLLGIVAAIIIGYAVFLDKWWLASIGVAGLAYFAINLPLLWIAAFLFSLPFYFSVNLPILPNRHFGLIDIGMAGGVCILLANRILASEWTSRKASSSGESTLTYASQWLPWSLAILSSWAFVSTVAAQYVGVALYEWRTVFLYAFVFSLLLQGIVTRGSSSPRVRERDLWLLVAGWQLGATTVAAIGLWHYLGGSMLISAEGVNRVRALYGSPNNLALYLERTVAVALSLALFLPQPARWRWGWIGVTIVQMLCLLLTFSKGSIVLGVPAIFATLIIAGFYVQHGRFVANRALIGLAIFALLVLLALVPFLGTERFRRLFDLSQGTGYLRMQLWRSSLQMALDHSWLGIGPDNFLYTFRSNYLLPGAWQEPDLNHPHNWILDWWTRLGLPGLFIGVYILWRGIWSLTRAMVHNASSTPTLTALYIGMLAASMGALAHGLIDASYALPDLMISWVLLFGLTVMARSGQSPPPK